MDIHLQYINYSFNYIKRKDQMFFDNCLYQESKLNIQIHRDQTLQPIHGKYETKSAMLIMTK